ncbi:MAG: hypothetical protein ABI461_17765 [Polyangiaceae bacterium]
MFKKIILVAGVFGTMSVMMAVGCSSSSDSAAGGGGSGTDSGAGKDGSSTKNDGGLSGGDGGSTVKDGGGGVHKDGGGSVLPTDGGTVAHLDAGSFDGGTTTADGGAIEACYTEGDALILTSAGPVAHQNKCNATQIASVLAGCFGGAATTATCNTALTGAPGCGQCILGSLPDGGIAPASPVTVPVDSAGDVEANLQGCAAALSTGNATCKSNFENQFVCEETVCGNNCADQASYDSCLNFASTDPGSLCLNDLPLDSTCADALNALTKTQLDSCGYSDTTFEGAFTKVSTVLCGP